MVALIAAPENMIFVVALVLMALIGAVLATGLAGDVDFDVGAELGDVLGWLGLGRLPLIALLVLFLALFGLVGLIGQQATHDLLGGYLPAWQAVPAALIASLPLTSGAARLVAPMIPRDETTAIDLDELVGRPARIVTGRAAPGSPARARVEDRHGQPHYVMVEPNGTVEIFEEGETVLLVRREVQAFRAISRGDFRVPRLEG